MFLGVTFYQRHVFIALVVRSLIHLLFKLFHVLLHGSNISISLLGFLADRRVVSKDHDLWQIAHLGVLGYAYRSLCRLLLSADNLEQR